MYAPTYRAKSCCGAVPCMEHAHAGHHAEANTLQERFPLRHQITDQQVGAVPAPEHACTALQGRNRRCITLDLHKEEGRDVLRRLSDRADVLIENFRPGVMEKWGLGPDVNPPHVCSPSSTRGLYSFRCRVWPWLLLRSALAQTRSCFSSVLLSRRRRCAACHRRLL